MLPEEVHIIESWKKYFQIYQQNTAPTAYYEKETPAFPDKISKNQHMKKNLQLQRIIRKL
jgi:hypothetical protein